MKNQIIFFVLYILVINKSFCQLTITNDNYIYVNDNVVFSEDYLDLHDLGSKFFLRNEAQFVQGSIDTGNKGIGELSVYQDGNVGAYEYNYWCSPVGETSPSNLNNDFGISLLNDIIDITNSTPASFNHDSNYNGTASPLNIEPYWIWKFIASNDYSEWIHVEDNTIVNPGEGFTMKGTLGTSFNNPGSNQNYDFRGKPNNGSISVEVLTDQFTLVGNPYPSAIDVVEYLHDPENKNIITGTLYYWEQNPDVDSHVITNYDGGYATYTINEFGDVETFVPAVFYTYNLDGTINTLGSGVPSGKIAKRYIPIGQGFMVEGQSNGYVKTKNNHRVYYKESSPLSSFFRTNNNENELYFTNIPEDYKRFRLNIIFNNHHTRQLVQTFNDAATPYFDYGLESKMHELLDSDAFWILNDDSFAAQANRFSMDLKIPIHINSNFNQNIVFEIIDIQNFDSNQPIYLHDKEQNLYVNLKEETYSIDVASNYYNNRFEIVFSDSPDVLNIEETIEENLTVIHDNINSEVKIYNPRNIELKNIVIYDMNGKQIFKDSDIGNKLYYNYSTSTFSSGIYILKIIHENEKVVINKKFIVDN